jgi:hypothetical protein
VIGDSRFHRWRHAQRFMYPAEIVIREIQSCAALWRSYFETPGAPGLVFFETWEDCLDLPQGKGTSPTERIKMLTSRRSERQQVFRTDRSRLPRSRKARDLGHPPLSKSGGCPGLLGWPNQLHNDGGNDGKQKARKLRMFGPDHSGQVEFPSPKADSRSDQTRY